jgi:hypothetical protein
LIVVVADGGHLHPRVVPSIKAQGYEALVIKCVNEVGHPLSYPRVLAAFMLNAGDVCFIEHDNESRPDFLDDLRDCPEPWCYFAYDLSVDYDTAVGITKPEPGLGRPSAPLGNEFAPLGHTRFRAGVGEKIRDLLESDFFAATWVSRDVLIAGALNDAGYLPHRHRRKCLHHHSYPVQDRG